MISVISNAYAKDFSEMTRLAAAGNMDKARKLHYKLQNIIHAIFVDGSPSGIKGLLCVLGVCSEHVRLPLTSVSRSVMNRFESIIKN